MTQILRVAELLNNLVAFFTGVRQCDKLVEELYSSEKRCLSEHGTLNRHEVLRCCIVLTHILHSHEEIKVA